MKQNKILQEKTAQNLENSFYLRLIQQIPGVKFSSISVSLFEQQKVLRKKKKITKPELFYPQWNNDQLCYTPSFVIPQDKFIFQKIKDTFKEGYLDQIKKHSQEISNDVTCNILLPYPRDQKYCGVCKISYMNFEEHINSLSHKQKCLKSPFTKHIHELCNQFGDSIIFKDRIQRNLSEKSQDFNDTEYLQTNSQTEETLGNSTEKTSVKYEKDLQQTMNHQQSFLSSESKAHLNKYIQTL